MSFRGSSGESGVKSSCKASTTIIAIIMGQDV
jgi:hypothetical protein